MILVAVVAILILAAVAASAARYMTALVTEFLRAARVAASVLAMTVIIAIMGLVLLARP